MAISFKEDTTAEIRKQIRAITALDIQKDLVKADDLGPYKFVERQHEFALILGLVHQLNEHELGNVPFNMLTALNRQLGSLWGTISAIRNFTLAEGQRDYQKQKDHLLRQFDDEDEKSTRMINEVIDIAKKFEQDNSVTHDVLSNEIQEKRRFIEARTREVEKHFDTAVNQVNEALATINEKSKEFGVSKYAAIFDTESGRHRTASFWWLGGTIFLLLAAIGYAILLLRLPMATNSNELLQMTITKVIIVTVLFLGLSLCIKNFRAQKHNQVLNRHRHNALTTFETFTAASTDPETKNAVLLEATRSIFSNQTTGYHAHESTDSDFPSKIIEIVKSPKA